MKPAKKKIEIVEIYVPRRLEYLARLYGWLRTQLELRDSSALFKGFSIYEVSGAYVGLKVYTEQTLVVRLMFDVPSRQREQLSHQARMDEIANEILKITDNQEEEVWLIRTSAAKIVCRPGRDENAISL